MNIRAELLYASRIAPVFRCLHTVKVRGGSIYKSHFSKVVIRRSDKLFLLKFTIIQYKKHKLLFLNNFLFRTAQLCQLDP